MFGSIYAMAGIDLTHVPPQSCAGESFGCQIPQRLCINTFTCCILWKQDHQRTICYNPCLHTTPIIPQMQNAEAVIGALRMAPLSMSSRDMQSGISMVGGDGAAVRGGEDRCLPGTSVADT